jgi:hypothetical protein
MPHDYFSHRSRNCWIGLWASKLLLKLQKQGVCDPWWPIPFGCRWRHASVPPMIAYLIITLAIIIVIASKAENV